MNLRYRFRRWYVSVVKGHEPPSCTECTDRATLVVGGEPRCFMHESGASPMPGMVRDVTLDDWVPSDAAMSFVDIVRGVMYGTGLVWLVSLAFLISLYL